MVVKEQRKTEVNTIRNIIKGSYERPEKYVSKKIKTRKIKKNYL